MRCISAIKKSIVNNNKGFTLIEMAVVLIIIGLIVGAVVKGKDLVTSAKQKKLYAKFVQEWQMAYNSFYDRSGQMLGDDPANTDNSNRDGNCGNGGSYASNTTLEGQLSRVGLEAPAEGATGNSTQRMYKDGNGNQYTLELRFCYDSGIGNFIRITDTGANGMPYDLGMAWDTIIDGQMDGQTGDFRYSSDGTAANIADWPAATGSPTSSSAGILLLQL